MKRLAPPLLLIIIGTVCLICGLTQSASQVFYEEEVTPPRPPPMRSMPPGMRPGPSGAMPFLSRPPEPPLREKIIVLRNVFEPESKIVLEVTRGGLMRIEDGRIKRTYTGAPPSGCPT